MAGEMKQLETTALGQAIISGDLEDVKHLIACEEIVDFTDRKKNTYLHLVCARYRPYIVDVLISAGLDVNAQNKHGYTPLHVQAVHHECGHVRDLLRSGAVTDIRDQTGRTALQQNTKSRFFTSLVNRSLPDIFEAIERHDLERVKHLLHCWYRLDARKRDGRTVRQYAAALGHHDIVAVFDSLKHTLDLVNAVKENDEERVVFNIKKLADVNYVNLESQVQHVLQHAVRHNNVTIVRALLGAGADVNMRINLHLYYKLGGKGPLYFECLKQTSGCDAAIILAVLEHADVTLKDERGRTALMLVCGNTEGDRKLHADLVRLMLTKGTNIAARDETGVTARGVAVLSRRRDLVKLIDEHVARAIEASEIETLRRLVTEGYDNCIVTLKGRDSLLMSAGNDTEDMFWFMETLPALLKCIQLLHELLQEGAPTWKISQFIDHLLKDRDTVIRGKNKGGRSVLHAAVVHGRRDVIDILLQPPCFSPDLLHIIDSLCRTPLHYAALAADESTWSHLLQLGAKDSRDVFDHTAQHYRDTQTDENATSWRKSECQKEFGLDLELHCAEKYEVLVRIIKSSRRHLTDFMAELKTLRVPVAKLHTLLVPRGHALMSGYKELLLEAVDHRREEIANHLVRLGCSLHRGHTYPPEEEGGERESLTAPERAERLGMTNVGRLMVHTLSRHYSRMIEHAGR